MVPFGRLFVRLPVYYGWIIVAVAFVTISVGTNTRTTFSLLFPSMLEEFGWGQAVTAATFSIGFLVSTVISPFIGALMDRYGPRYVIPAGVFVIAAGLMLAPLATNPVYLYVTWGGMVVGLTPLVSYSGHSFFLPFWFARNRGLAMGIAFSGVGVIAIAFFRGLR